MLDVLSPVKSQLQWIVLGRVIRLGVVIGDILETTSLCLAVHLECLKSVEQRNASIAHFVTMSLSKAYMGAIALSGTTLLFCLYVAFGIYSDVQSFWAELDNEMDSFKVRVVFLQPEQSISV